MQKRSLPETEEVDQRPFWCCGCGFPRSARHCDVCSDRRWTAGHYDLIPNERGYVPGDAAIEAAFRIGGGEAVVALIEERRARSS